MRDCLTSKTKGLTQISFNWKQLQYSTNVGEPQKKLTNVCRKVIYFFKKNNFNDIIGRTDGQNIMILDIATPMI